MELKKVYHHILGEERKGKYYSYGNAEFCVGKIYKNCELFGLTNGNFSLFDIIEVILNQTGNANVDIATWTAAKADTKRAKKFVDCNIIKKLRFVVDPSFRSRQPEYCDYIKKAFGDSLRTVKTHAKFVLIYNEKWNIVIRTSMNLNMNSRIENFEISENLEFRKFYSSFVNDIFKQKIDDNFNQNLDFKTKEVKNNKKECNFSDFGLDEKKIFEGLL